MNGCASIVNCATSHSTSSGASPACQGRQNTTAASFSGIANDGTIWYQAQTSPEGGYIFGETPIDGKLTGFNELKNMTENRVKPAGQWNAYDIRCVAETCTLAVNGAVVNTIHNAGEKGYIGLEAEGYRIEFKDFKIQELP